MKDNECQAEFGLPPALVGRKVLGQSLAASKDGQMQSSICKANSGCPTGWLKENVEAGRTVLLEEKEREKLTCGKKFYGGEVSHDSQRRMR